MGVSPTPAVPPAPSARLGIVSALLVIAVMVVVMMLVAQQFDRLLLLSG